VFFPFRLQFCGKTILIAGYALFHFLPSRRAILVSNADDPMDDLVDFSSVIARDFYSSFPEHALQMPEVTGHIKPHDSK
jgi:hypothetical protein